MSKVWSPSAQIMPLWTQPPGTLDGKWDGLLTLFILKVPKKSKSGTEPLKDTQAIPCLEITWTYFLLSCLLTFSHDDVTHSDEHKSQFPWNSSVIFFMGNVKEKWTHWMRSCYINGAGWLPLCTQSHHRPNISNHSQLSNLPPPQSGSYLLNLKTNQFEQRSAAQAKELPRPKTFQAVCLIIYLQKVWTAIRST